MKKAFFYCLYTIIVLGALVACIAFGTKNFSTGDSEASVTQEEQQEDIPTDYATKLELNCSYNTIYVSVGARFSFLSEIITIEPETMRDEIEMQVTANNASTHATGITYEGMNFEVLEVGSYKVTFRVKSSGTKPLEDSILITAKDELTRPYAQLNELDIMKDTEYNLTDLFTIDRDVYQVQYGANSDVISSNNNLTFTNTGYQSVEFVFTSAYIKFYQTLILFVQDENTPLPETIVYATKLNLNVSTIYMRVGTSIELKDNFYSVEPADKKAKIPVLLEINGRTGCVVSNNVIKANATGTYTMQVSVKSGENENITKAITICVQSACADPYVIEKQHGILYQDTEYNTADLFQVMNAESFVPTIISTDATINSESCIFNKGGIVNIKYKFEKFYYNIINSFDISVNYTPDFYIEEYQYDGDVTAKLTKSQIALFVNVGDRNNEAVAQNFTVEVEDNEVAELKENPNPPLVYITLKKIGSTKITIVLTADPTIKYTFTLTVK